MGPLKFQNFTSADRKRNIAGFAMLPRLQDLSWIDDNNLEPQTATLTPTPDGATLTFTVTIANGGLLDSSMPFYRNGVLQLYGVQYTFPSPTQVTFISPFVPQSTDYFQVVSASTSTMPVFAAPANSFPMTLTPTPNGVTTAFTMAISGVSVISPTIAIFRNGLLQAPTTDYSLVGAAITFVVAPDVTDTFRVVT